MSGGRIRSIDIFRALTMLLMIFVNDLWTLSGIPGWLEHKAAHEDGLGLADMVFPAFLFIVGLSIPHAIRARKERGQDNTAILFHILERSLALLIMGVFMVNLENIAQDHLVIGRYAWQILMTVGFFLIWNHYRGKVLGRIPPLAMKLTGWAILIFLAAIYAGNGNGNTHWMRFHWWGILGLIGWGYLVSTLIWLVTGNRPLLLAGITVLMLLVNVNEFNPPFGFTIRLVVSASNYASVMTGVLVTSIMISLREKGRIELLVPVLAGIAAVLLFFGYSTRPLWGISKIMATPSWTAICAAISVLGFAILHVVCDRMNLTRWAVPIAPAGYATLTCYLVPYFVYPVAAMTGLHLPDFLTTGLVGIAKSLVFSLLIIALTGLLTRIGIRLKI